MEEVSRASFHFEPLRWIWYLLNKFLRNLNPTNAGLFISENDRRNNYHIINGIVATLVVHERSIDVIDAQKVTLKYFVSTDEDSYIRYLIYWKSSTRCIRVLEIIWQVCYLDDLGMLDFTKLVKNVTFYYYCIRADESDVETLLGKMLNGVDVLNLTELQGWNIIPYRYYIRLR